MQIENSVTRDNWTWSVTQDVYCFESLGKPFDAKRTVTLVMEFSIRTSKPLKTLIVKKQDTYVYVHNNYHKVLLHYILSVPYYMGRVKRIWYLSHMRAAKVQASCSLIQAVSQEEPSDKKPDPWPL